MKPSVLLVDDDPAVLSSLARHLRDDFTVSFADSGRAAIDALRNGSFAVIVSDLRMPGIDGVEVLSHAQDLAPDTVRILLTGHADMDAATRAVNLGQVFRFLTKPVPAKDIATVLRTAVRQHALHTAERELLERTLHGSVQTLLDTLALANPHAFARAARVRKLVVEMLDVLEITNRWHIEVAAGLAHLGAVTLPSRTAERLHSGMPLDHDEAEAVAKLPALASRLLENIPRLEAVRTIVALQDRRFDGAPHADGPKAQDIPFGARMLKVALDTDALLVTGMSLARIVDVLELRSGAYDSAVLRALHLLVALEPVKTREITVEELRNDMVLVEDVLDDAGILLVGSGQRVTESLIERVRNFHRTGGVAQPLHVQDPPTARTSLDTVGVPQLVR